jgi:hypothetical protein
MYRRNMSSGRPFIVLYFLSQGHQLCDRAFAVASCAEGRRDNHDLNLHTNLYFMRYRTYTSEVSEWVILRPTVSLPICFRIKPPSGAYDQIIITVRELLVCWYGAPSLTRGRVCFLQLLLSSSVQSVSDPSPAGLMTTFYCLNTSEVYRQMS